MINPFYFLRLASLWTLKNPEGKKREIKSVWYRTQALLAQKQPHHLPLLCLSPSTFSPHTRLQCSASLFWSCRREEAIKKSPGGPTSQSMGRQTGRNINRRTQKHRQTDGQAVRKLRQADRWLQGSCTRWRWQRWQVCMLGVGVCVGQCGGCMNIWWEAYVPEPHKFTHSLHPLGCVNAYGVDSPQVYSKLIRKQEGEVCLCCKPDKILLRLCLELEKTMKLNFFPM